MPLRKWPKMRVWVPVRMRIVSLYEASTMYQVCAASILTTSLAKWLSGEGYWWQGGSSLDPRYTGKRVIKAEPRENKSRLIPEFECFHFSWTEEDGLLCSPMCCNLPCLLPTAGITRWLQCSSLLNLEASWDLFSTPSSLWVLLSSGCTLEYLRSF